MEVVAAGVRIGVAERARRGETVSGDAFAIHGEDGRCRIAVIDGAGHGPAAAAASGLAREIFVANPVAEPADCLARCHQALKPTRGAVMTLAVIDAAAGRLTLAGAGNIETRLCAGEQEQTLVTQRGLLGFALPTIRPVTVEIGQEWVLVLHSDGVRARYSLRDPALPSAREPGVLASHLLEAYARAEDDALIVVAVPEEGMVA